MHIESGPDRSYGITVQHGLMRKLPGLIASAWPGCGIRIITDSNVLRLYGRRLQLDFLKQGINALTLDFPAGERSKDIVTVRALQDQLLRDGIDRQTLIIALGGGVVGDVAGFVAATLLRGLKYIQVPTSLLAQVDSSIGGKVGINHRLGKNLIGAYHQPAAVYIDPLVLRTLPPREFKNGLVEVVKIAAAADRTLFTALRRDARRLNRDLSDSLSSMITRAVQLKAAIVQRDERDEGLRKILSLGHTLGHALEASTGYRISHGEAVALGLVAESSIAVQMRLMNEEDCARLVELLNVLGLVRRRLPSIDRWKFFQALGADKKSERGASKFALLRRIGNPVIGIEVPTPHIIELFERWRKRS